MYQGREQLVIPGNTLVFYLDDSGDERLNDSNHPVFAFGGVSCVSEFHIPIAGAWKDMKRRAFPQVKGPLHAATHMREGKLSETKRAAVLQAMEHRQLGRVGTLVTNQTIVRPDRIVQVACLTLVKRLGSVAAGMAQLGLWSPSPHQGIIVVFEASSRLARQIEQHLSGACCVVEGLELPILGCFMPKSVANPFLEMADFVVNAIARNVKHQIEGGRQDCTPSFQALFRDVGPPLVDYIEITRVM
jgi:hypothetical protein